MKKILLLVTLPFIMNGQFCVRNYDQNITQGINTYLNFKFINTGCSICSWDSISIRLENYFITETTKVNLYTSYPLVGDTANASCSTGYADSVSHVIYLVPYTVAAGGANYYIDFWKQGSLLGIQSYPVYVYASAFGINAIHSNRKLTKTEYFDLLGHQLQTPLTGINVVVNYYSDGSVERKKILTQ